MSDLTSNTGAKPRSPADQYADQFYQEETQYWDEENDRLADGKRAGYYIPKPTTSVKSDAKTDKEDEAPKSKTEPKPAPVNNPKPKESKDDSSKEDTST